MPLKEGLALEAEDEDVLDVLDGGEGAALPMLVD